MWLLTVFSDSAILSIAYHLYYDAYLHVVHVILLSITESMSTSHRYRKGQYLSDLSIHILALHNTLTLYLMTNSNYNINNYHYEYYLLNLSCEDYTLIFFFVEDE